MAISPPSDIVMDVVNAADPGKVQEAQDRMKAASATLAAARLTQAGQGFSADVASIDQTVGTPAVSTAHASAKGSHTPPAYRKFEAMVLQNFIQYMLPSNSSEVYGQGEAGDVWKGMMAEQLANTIAKRGGIGIADRLMRGGQYDQGLVGAVHSQEKAHNSNVAQSIADQQQRQIFADLVPSADHDKNSSTL